MILIHAHLAFWLKYPQQMHYLTQPDPDTALLENPEAVRSQVSRVAEYAEAEGAALLLEVGAIFESVLSDVAELRPKKPRHNAIKWGYDALISPLGGGPNVLFGFSLYRTGSALYPWMWFKNHIVAEKAWSLVIEDLGGLKPEKEGGWTCYFPHAEFAGRLSEPSPINVDQEIEQMIAPFRKLNPELVTQLCTSSS